MAFPNDNLVQDAVYWPPTAPDVYGKPGFGSPVAIKCRWEDIEGETISVSGTDVRISSQVFVDRDLKLDGVVWLGLVADADPVPLQNIGAAIIARFQKIPTLDATAFQRVAYL